MLQSVPCDQKQGESSLAGKQFFGRPRFNQGTEALTVPLLNLANEEVYRVELPPHLQREPRAVEIKRVPRSRFLVHTGVMRLTIITALFGMLFAVPLAAEEIQDIKGDDADAELYQEIIQDADAAAENGDYDEAIALWQKSIPLQQVTNEACRGAKQQIYIEVAREAKRKIDRDDLSDDEVQNWFDSRAESLWEKSTCADE